MLERVSDCLSNAWKNITLYRSRKMCKIHDEVEVVDWKIETTVKLLKVPDKDHIGIIGIKQRHCNEVRSSSTMRFLGVFCPTSRLFFFLHWVRRAQSASDLNYSVLCIVFEQKRLKNRKNVSSLGSSSMPAAECPYHLERWSIQQSESLTGKNSENVG